MPCEHSLHLKLTEIASTDDTDGQIVLSVQDYDGNELAGGVTEHENPTAAVADVLADLGYTIDRTKLTVLTYHMEGRTDEEVFGLAIVKDDWIPVLKVEEPEVLEYRVCWRWAPGELSDGTTEHKDRELTDLVTAQRRVIFQRKTWPLDIAEIWIESSPVRVWTRVEV